MLVQKLDDYTSEGLEHNKFILYNIGINKEDSRYLFSIRFNLGVPFPVVLARIILLNVREETYQSKNVPVNISILVLLLIVTLASVVDLFLNFDKIDNDIVWLKVIGITVSWFVLAILPFYILRNFMNEILKGYLQNEN